MESKQNRIMLPDGYFHLELGKMLALLCGIIAGGTFAHIMRTHGEPQAIMGWPQAIKFVFADLMTYLIATLPTAIIRGLYVRNKFNKLSNDPFVGRFNGLLSGVTIFATCNIGVVIKDFSQIYGYEINAVGISAILLALVAICEFPSEKKERIYQARLTRIKTEIADNFVNSLKRHGVSEFHILTRYFTPENETECDAVAKLIVSTDFGRIKSTANVFRVAITGKKRTIEELESAYKITDSDFKIDTPETADSREISGQEPRTAYFEYVCMNRKSSKKEVLAEMDKRGLHPALFGELLDFNDQYPEEKNGRQIAALGTIWTSDISGSSSMACIDQLVGLSSYLSMFPVSIRESGGDWKDIDDLSENFYFLAVSK